MGASEATLLNMLNISPFSFGLVIQQVFDNGSIYNPEVLDITEDTLHKRFLEVSASALYPLGSAIHLPARGKMCSRRCPRTKRVLWCFLQAVESECPGETVTEHLV